MTDFDLKTEAKKLLWLLPGLVFYALFRLSFLVPQFVETVYSRSIFFHVNSVLSSATGLLPFSLAEFLLYIFVLSVAVYVIFSVIHAIKAGRAWWQAVLRRTAVLLSAASLLYALFIGLWGFNYARMPLSKTLNLDASLSSVNELYSVCGTLISRANTLRESVPENNDGVFYPKDSKAEIMRSINGYYSKAADTAGLDFLGGNFGSIKPVLCSRGLSWSHISGIYFPYTGEANVNTDAPMLLFAASCLHEAAHQRGFAREDEANFLAFYISSFSGDVSIEYSGTMLALINSMNALYNTDPNLYYELRQNYSYAIERDLADRGRYWAEYEGSISEAAREVNNTFLKANMQHDGVQSYGRMVDLIIALWRSGELQ